MTYDLLGFQKAIVSQINNKRNLHSELVTSTWAENLSGLNHFALAAKLQPLNLWA